jgi:hypothetical protein
MFFMIVELAMEVESLLAPRSDRSLRIHL